MDHFKPKIWTILSTLMIMTMVWDDIFLGRCFAQDYEGDPEEGNDDSSNHVRNILRQAVGLSKDEGLPFVNMVAFRPTNRNLIENLILTGLSDESLARVQDVNNKLCDGAKLNPAFSRCYMEAFMRV